MGECGLERPIFTNNPSTITENISLWEGVVLLKGNRCMYEHIVSISFDIQMGRKPLCPESKRAKYLQGLSKDLQNLVQAIQLLSVGPHTRGQ